MSGDRLVIYFNRSVVSLFAIYAMALALAILGIGGCATKPTVTHENPERRFDASALMLTQVRIDDATVLIDARPAFEYSMAHVPRSVNLQWSEFTEPDPDNRGGVLSDPFGLARRLALKGINPSRHVVVFGKGLGGDGEEGRVAWMLAFLGVTNVQFSSLDALKLRMTNVVDELGAKSVSIWKPELVLDLNVNREELIAAINRRAVEKPMAFRQGDMLRTYRIIDVREARNYLGREGLGAKQQIPNMDAVNIPWRDFFDVRLRPREEIVRRLTEIGVLPEHRILVIDEDGVSSGAVTMALRALGFAHAGNCAGGLKDLLAAYPVTR